MSVLPFFVCAMFCLYAIFDFFSLIIRISAAQCRRNAAGAAYEKIMNTVKRVFMFLYPPVLGLMAAHGRSDLVFHSIFLSYFCAAICIVVLVFLRRIMLNYFCAVIDRFSAGAGVLTSFLARPPIVEGAFRDGGWVRPLRGVWGKNNRFLFSMTWVNFVYGSSIFAVNIAAIAFKEYDVVILQLLGIYNAMGTLLMAFIVDPRVSISLDENADLDQLFGVFALALLLNYCLVGPMLFGLIYFSVGT